MAKTRIYVVNAGGNGEQKKPYLVEATHPNVAERHVGHKFVEKAEVAEPKRIVELMKSGVVVESATEEAA